MLIQTVYKPEENVDYLRDWLTHHTAIGVTHFYLYDNGGAHDYPDADYNVPAGVNKHGIECKYSVEEAREIESEIIKDFPVTKVMWQNRNESGKLLYNQPGSILHFKNMVKSDLCAFIDIDEFIIKNEEFRPSRLIQRKFKSRSYYNSVHDCLDLWPVNCRNWGPKVILDMANFPDFRPDQFAEHDIHFRHVNLPFSKSWFNHYNYTPTAHWYFLNIQKNDSNIGEIAQAILKNNKNLDVETHFNSLFKKIENSGLKK